MIKNTVVNVVKQLIKHETDAERLKRLAAKCTKRGHHEYGKVGKCVCGIALPH